MAANNLYNNNVHVTRVPDLNAILSQTGVSEERLSQEVSEAIAAGVDVNMQDYSRTTPLHKAVSRGYTDIVKKLIHAGAHVNIAAGNGYTPLHWSSRSEIMQLLIDAGANVNKSAPGLFSPTPLTMAILRNDSELVRTLLTAGANIRREDWQAYITGTGTNPEIRRLLMDAEAWKRRGPLVMNYSLRNSRKAQRKSRKYRKTRKGRK